MQHWTGTCQNRVAEDALRYIRPSDLYLDIETLGFSRDRHPIYLIGTGSLINHNIIYVNQWFADSTDDEPAVLAAFSEYLEKSDADRLSTFNGDAFDLPFIETRARLCGISLDIGRFESFDLYKEIKRRASYLQLPDYRQKTIERFLGVGREDSYSGGELIRVYHSYTKNRDAEAARALRLHNFEDVAGMFDLPAIFSYDRLFTETPRITGASVEDYADLDGLPAEELIVEIEPPCSLRGKLSCSHPVSGAYLLASGGAARLRIPMIRGEARLYYADYKNYYYLPEEDMAVHKSVAAGVDKEYRKKATPENCYTRVAITEEFLHSDRLAEYVAHILSAFL